MTLLVLFLIYLLLIPEKKKFGSRTPHAVVYIVKMMPSESAIKSKTRLFYRLKSLSARRPTNTHINSTHINSTDMTITRLPFSHISIPSVHSHQSANRYTRTRWRAPEQCVSAIPARERARDLRALQALHGYTQRF